MRPRPEIKPANAYRHHINKANDWLGYEMICLAIGVISVFISIPAEHIRRFVFFITGAAVVMALYCWRQYKWHDNEATAILERAYLWKGTPR